MAEYHIRTFHDVDPFYEAGPLKKFDVTSCCNAPAVRINRLQAPYNPELDMQEYFIEYPCDVALRDTDYKKRPWIAANHNVIPVSCCDTCGRISKFYTDPIPHQLAPDEVNPTWEGPVTLKDLIEGGHTVLIHGRKVTPYGIYSEDE